MSRADEADPDELKSVSPRGAGFHARREHARGAEETEDFPAFNETSRFPSRGESHAHLHRRHAAQEGREVEIDCVASFD